MEITFRIRICRIRMCFEPPGFGSGSISTRYRSGSFYNESKIVRKTLIPTILCLLYDFLSLKWVNVATKSNKQKKLRKKKFLLSFSRSLTKYQDLDLDPNPDPLVRGRDPRIKIWIRTKMSLIPNTVWKNDSMFEQVIQQRIIIQTGCLIGIVQYIVFTVHWQICHNCRVYTYSIST